ncbi:hypothetical protein HK105_207519 [Polyrhizophydium stewartii]|uniref:RING-type domain-containing protein n=1 Tax=Polyrhizophydium stewartii TaxID=2732419 RepID=A0ABR4N094_9FUNG|nr:hypothetical protein HK105_006430 [Polyrhizophydium stewartii]
MDAYMIEHGIAPTRGRRTPPSGAGSSSALNPDIADFMGTSRTAAEHLAQTQRQMQQMMAAASMYAALRERHAGASAAGVGAAAGGEAEQRVLDNLITQLMEEANASGKGTPPASKAFVAGLERVTAVAKDSTCHVCLEACEPARDTIHRLPCTHLFHAECILPWLELHNSCPVCRREYPTDDAEYEKRRRERELAELRANDSEEEWDPFYG